MNSFSRSTERLEGISVWGARRASCSRWVRKRRMTCPRSFSWLVVEPELEPRNESPDGVAWAYRFSTTYLFRIKLKVCLLHLLYIEDSWKSSRFRIDRLKFASRLSTFSTVVSQASYLIFPSLSSFICKMEVIGPISKCCNEHYMSQKYKTANTVSLYTDSR